MQLAISEGRGPFHERAHQHFLKDNTACACWFSYSLVEKTLWELIVIVPMKINNSYCYFLSIKERTKEAVFKIAPFLSEGNFL